MSYQDVELHMWKYWCEKYGYERAAEEYYPEIFSSDPVLLAAMSQLKAAKASIDARMDILGPNPHEEEL